MNGDWRKLAEAAERLAGRLEAPRRELCGAAKTGGLAACSRKAGRKRGKPARAGKGAAAKGSGPGRWRKGTKKGGKDGF